MAVRLRTQQRNKKKIIIIMCNNKFPTAAVGIHKRMHDLIGWRVISFHAAVTAKGSQAKVRAKQFAQSLVTN